MDKPKTSEVNSVLKALEADYSTLVVLAKANENTWKSVRNINKVDMTVLGDMNAYGALRRKNIVMTKDALVAIPEEIK
jgi:large subunit ribosomal protein L4